MLSWRLRERVKWLIKIYEEVLIILLLKSTTNFKWGASMVMLVAYWTTWVQISAWAYLKGALLTLSAVFMESWCSSLCPAPGVTELNKVLNIQPKFLNSTINTFLYLTKKCWLVGVGFYWSREVITGVWTSVSFLDLVSIIKDLMEYRVWKGSCRLIASVHIHLGVTGSNINISWSRQVKQKW